jgi:acetylornithine deacetylase
VSLKLVAVGALLADDELLRRLVGFDSVSRNSNLPMADFIADYLDRPGAGIRVARNPSADGGKVNLVVQAGSETHPLERRGLMLSGHMDVVPADEPEWETDPFELVRRDERFVGRGTADMKGFLALAMNQVARIEPSRLRRPLALLFTFDEELGTLGARHFVETWGNPEDLPRRVVIGEPTSLGVVRMHKGHLKLRIAIRGVAAHSGYPHLGKNAIEPAGSAIQALAALRAELEGERPPAAEHFPEVPFVALNVAQVSGGTAVNVVPDGCEILVGIRVLPGMRSDDLVERVRGALTPALAGGDWTLDAEGDSPPFHLDAEHPLHRALCDEVCQSGSLSVAFATDAGWLQTAGFDCVVCGPGTIEVAHKPNESLPVADFLRGGELLGRFIHRFCLAETA